MIIESLTMMVVVLDDADRHVCGRGAYGDAGVAGAFVLFMCHERDCPGFAVLHAEGAVGGRHDSVVRMGASRLGFDRPGLGRGGGRRGMKGVVMRHVDVRARHRLAVAIHHHSVDGMFGAALPAALAPAASVEAVTAIRRPITQEQ